ncbi:hypothetical protein MEX01_43490 [Methylorubrum extorquens]|uniref:hypothetical protein n=1 Tax=Methylorubrum extorquens TaxID=408 RepID=UPI00116C2D76|nr:hypothetical protein [Methylorubrum extorquens]GEL43758.1 hypothetical protein MEX01_43490 [Methylorubrum extorquens]
MLKNHDERCAADLALTVENRNLTQDVAGWLARVVTGAVRPNRDKPLWDLAHALTAFAQLIGARHGRDLVDFVLDPRLNAGTALEQRFSDRAREGVKIDAYGLVLTLGPRHWRISWPGAARLLALAEFALTAEDLAQFHTVTGWFDELVANPSTASVDLLVTRLSRNLKVYRHNHLPLAKYEKRFHGMLAFLAARAAGGNLCAFTDDDILEFWRAEMEDDERPGFRTTAEHFVTLESAVSTLGGLVGLRAAASLDADEAWHDRIDTSLADIVGNEPMAGLAEMLLGLPEGPKILTGAERDELADLLRLEPFHRTRPLTTLRAVSFGRVQSGIANRLRRRGGGAEVAERAACTEAESYDAISERAASLAAHLKRMVGIAACLRLPLETADAELRAALQAGEADLKRVRRAGFDCDRAALSAAFAAVDEILVRVAEEVALLIRAIHSLDAPQPLSEIFAADLSIFAETLTQAYARKDML